MSLHDALFAWSSAKATLLALYPSLAEDDPALIDSLDGETNVTEAIAKVIRSAEDDRAMAAALKIRMAEMGERAARLEARIEHKREIAAKAMDQCGLKRVEAPDFTASLAQGKPKVIITDETALEAAYLFTPAPKPDKTKIAEHLKGGCIVPGATLSNSPPHLTVRRT